MSFPVRSPSVDAPVSQGAQVVLVNLTQDQRIVNGVDRLGQSGIVVEYLPTQGLYSVRMLSDGELVAVPTSKLQVIVDSQMGSRPSTIRAISRANNPKSPKTKARTRGRAATDAQDRVPFSALQRVITIEFEPGLAVGATEENGAITRVAPNSQAYRLGVKPGWMITHVNNESAGGALAADRIRGCQTMGRPYTISFRRVARTPARQTRSGRSPRARSASPVTPMQRTAFSWAPNDRVRVTETFRLSKRQPGALGVVDAVQPDGKIRVRWDSGRIQVLKNTLFSKIEKVDASSVPPPPRKASRRKFYSPQANPRRAMGLPSQSAARRGRSYSPKRGGFKRKMGPRETGRNRVKLASERAGIKPMKYSEQTWDPNFTKKKITKSSLKGFSSTTKSSRGTANIGRNQSGRKMGPREARKQGPRVKLASERAGIKPLVYSEMVHDADFTKKKVTSASLKGFSVTKKKGGAGNNAAVSASGRKLGPRDFRKSPKLASERAGIKPMKYSEMTHDPDFTKKKVTKASLRGFSATRAKDEAGNMFAGQRKMGPSEMRLNSSSAKLASEAAGIKPAKYSEMTHDPNFTKKKVTRAALQGFSTNN